MSISKEYVVLKIGTIKNEDSHKIDNFFENFKNKLCKQNFMLAKKPVEEIFAKSIKDVIEKVQQTTAWLDKNSVNAEILFVFHENMQPEFIKIPLEKRFGERYKIFMLKISMLNDFEAGSSNRKHQSYSSAVKGKEPDGADRTTSFLEFIQNFREICECQSGQDNHENIPNENELSVYHKSVIERFREKKKGIGSIAKALQISPEGIRKHFNQRKINRPKTNKNGEAIKKKRARTFSIQSVNGFQKGFSSKQSHLEITEIYPPEDFRTLTIIPNKHDIVSSKEPFLRSVQRQFKDMEDYLDIHFRLLREDMLHDLRKGIRQYRSGGIQETDLFVYQNVTIDQPVIQPDLGEFIYNLHLKKSHRLFRGKHLKYGSLLCLSNDGFKSNFIFAVILEQKQLKKGIVGLKIPISEQINFETSYIMVESPAFFEAYRHVMNALQGINNLPFSEIILGEVNRPTLPSYLEEKNNEIFDFKTLLPTSKKQESICRLSNLCQKLNHRDFGMDESQFEALHYALSSNLAIIQGPPGTGKTFIGQQITKLLLDNKEVWQMDGEHSPILVVCYTNHALDQFLEKILEFISERHRNFAYNQVVRIGGRCKKEALENCKLFNMRRFSSMFHEYRKEKFNLYRVVVDLQENTKIVNILKSGKASLNYLINTINSYNGECFGKGNLSSINKTLAQWMTRANKNQDKRNEPNFAVIRKIMGFGFDEIPAKNASYLKYGQSVIDIVTFLSKNRNKGNIFNAAMEGVKNWPKLKEFDFLVKAYKMYEEVALQMLLSYNGDFKTLKKDFDHYFFSKQAQAKTVDENLNEMNYDQENDQQLDQYNERKILDQEDDWFQEFERENHINSENKRISDVSQPSKKKRRRRKKNEENIEWYQCENMEIFLDYIQKVSPMNETEVENFIDMDIWDLPLLDRWRLFQFWQHKAIEELERKIAIFDENYQKVLHYVNGLREKIDFEILNKSKIIGMTTTGAAIHQELLQKLRPRIVIIEEAAEILESHLITSLTTACQHLILIGDHQQLRPSPAVFDLAKNYHLDWSLFERLIKNGYPYKTLVEQHRMRPEISQTLMPMFYKDLKDNDSVLSYENIYGMQKDMVFFNHSYPEKVDEDLKSISNQFEAYMAIGLAKYLLQQNYYPQSINILTTYLAQLIELKEVAKEEFDQSGIPVHKVRMEVVDNYQGEECDIIILSMVRSNNQKGIGFLMKKNRVCVALSRAKYGLYVLANMDFFANCSELWKRIKTKVNQSGALLDHFPIICPKHNVFQEIRNPDEFYENCPYGGCNRLCMAPVPCGVNFQHFCFQKCHSNDDGVYHTCTLPCEKSCNNGHLCVKKCYEDCHPCTQLMEKSLPCGHRTKDECYKHPRDIVCEEEIEKRKLKCGHEVVVKCYQKNFADIKCFEKVSKIFPLCQHKVEMACHIDVAKLKCPEPCKMQLGCGHFCKGSCGECRYGRLHVLCQEKCSKTLVCGHNCESKCCEVCPPCKQPFNSLGCGHRQLKTESSGPNVLCSDFCSPCTEPCQNKCVHRKCERLCWEECNVKPCLEPCNKELACASKGKKNGKRKLRHLCMGVCGEACLEDLCKYCNNQDYIKVKEMNGVKNEKNARFIQLVDCGHYIEVKRLDQHIKNKINSHSSKSNDGDDKNNSILTEMFDIDCPECSLPIRNSKTYIHILNKRIINIEQLKYHLLGKSEAMLEKEWDTLFDHILDRFDAILDNFSHQSAVTKFKFYLTVLENTFEELQNEVLSTSLFMIIKNILRFVEKFGQLATNLMKINKEIFATNLENLYLLRELLSQFNIYNMNEFLWDELFLLMSRIAVKDMKNVSEALMVQLSFEIQRFEFIFHLFNFISKLLENHMDIDFEDKTDLTIIFDGLFGCQEFQENIQDSLWNIFDKMQKRNTNVSGLISTRSPSVIVLLPIEWHVKKWFRCSKGHAYALKDEAQPTALLTCIECQKDL